MLAVGAWSTEWRLADLVTFAMLTVCALISIEVSLRLVWRRPTSGTGGNDLLAVWTIPVVLVLPPFYSALVTIPLLAFAQVRLVRRQVFKLAFSVACTGLAGFAAATMRSVFLQTDVTRSVRDLVGSPRTFLILAACIGLRQALNVGLIGKVVAMTRPGARTFDFFHDREYWATSAAESCTGVLVAIASLASAYAVLLAIPPVLVLQRTLLLAEFREAARTDPKTGLANSVYWREVAERELARARGGSENLAVLLVDVDHFKSINDRFGHLTGDEVLRTVANGLTHGLRPHDLVGRFGGEEFVVLLVGSDIEQAQHAAERIRAHIATLDIDVLNKEEPVQVTISIGAAAFRESGYSIHELLDAADGALYAAKHAGRNCVRTALGTRQQVLDLADNEPRVIDLRTHPARVE